MANDKRSDPRKKFVPRILPWLLAAAAFAVYFLTLNHWVSLLSLGTVAKVSGWTWQPEVFNPLFFVVTYPFHWLSAAQIPAALNVFSAICAALTLGLLARSVAILPHDRTDAQRERERSDFSFLTGWSAWLPPVFAVAACGLQLTFWQHATNCTTEMFELLLVAFVIWSLLEFRLDEREGRLFLAATVYGAGMAENWAMVGFLPFFIAAIIWIRGLRFFNLTFLKWMVLAGLAGMLFYLLLPMVTVFSHDGSVTFWQALRANLAAQWDMVKLFFVQPEVRKTVFLLSPASLLPILIMAIRWQSSFGESSKLGLLLVNFMFHLIHAILLFVCVWVAFDSPLSPRHLGFGMPFLTFYYLGALGVGYYTGYFLLVFSKLPPERARNRPGQQRPDPFESFNWVISTAVWLFAALAMAGLVYRNAPQIRNINDDTFKNYTALAEAKLPAKGGILLSDDARRMLLLQAALARNGRAKEFLMADTQYLPLPAYHRYLHKKFPAIWPDTVAPSEITNGVGPLHLIGLLATLAKTNELYYLHPSFGYYFEQFYLEPHGLVYKLDTLPNDTLLPPKPDKNLIAENEAFWAQAKATAFAPVIQALRPPEPNASKSFGDKLLDRFHVAREPNPNALIAGMFYSRSLDFWGVRMQRAGYLTNAAAHFELAQKLNPDNVVAKVNLDFNRSLATGQTVPIDLSRATIDQFGKYSSWNALIGDNGPFDEPSFTFKNGVILMSGGVMRQAVEDFERVRQLVPENLAARLWLAQAYLGSRLPDRALDALRAPIDHPETFSLNLTNSTQLNILAAAAYFQKNNTQRGVELIQGEISRQPNNDVLLGTATQIYFQRGLYSNALVIIDRKLKAAPEDPTWLFGKGYASMQLKDYDNAITALTHVLAIQTTNSEALFNRAVANLQSGRLDAARTDYERLGRTYTNSFRIAYGLGEIAWQKHETNEAIKYFQAYLTTANTNTAEATNIIERLKSLRP